VVNVGEELEEVIAGDAAIALAFQLLPYLQQVLLVL
jgi:hypothetical protein